MVRVMLSTFMIAVFAQSRPQYFNLLSAQFPKNNVPLKCMTCHNGRAVNLFGTDYYSVFVAGNPLKIPGINVMTDKQKWDLLLNKMDSNKNGVSNYQDIVEGKNPGLLQR